MPAANGKEENACCPLPSGRSRPGSGTRADIHAAIPFWLEPRIELARNYGLSIRQVNAALRLIQERED